ncbi:MAG: hypothetical protein ABI810_08100 [Sphingomonas bacterium]
MTASKKAIGAWARTADKPGNLPLIGQYSAEDVERFKTSTRLYLETSAFNYFVDTYSLPDLELTRAYQRRKGVIFVTSPTLLWEIMLNTDRERADMMLMAAQALFDPVMLGTPTELTVRYLRSAYPENVVNYDITVGSPWAHRWPAMTRDFAHTIDYDFDDLVRRTSSLRAISKNLSSVLEGKDHPAPIVHLSGLFVTTLYSSIRDDIETWGMDETLAKFVILYAFLLLMAYADLDGTPAKDFWAERGFHGERANEEVTRLFLDYPEIFRQGPLLSMAIMAMLQHAAGIANRGALHDGMHMIYAPHVDAIISIDKAFLGLASSSPYFREKVKHLKELNMRSVELRLDDFPDDRKLRFD